jgi:elongation factor Ts
MLKASNTTVQRFALFVVGEGIEKRQDDFAAEVAAQVAAASKQ